MHLCVAGEGSQHREQVALLEKQVAELKEQLHAKDTVVEETKTKMESLMRSHKADMKVHWQTGSCDNQNWQTGTCDRRRLMSE